MVIQHYNDGPFKFFLDTLKDKYPNTIHLIYCYEWYEAFGDDAKIIADIFGYKLFERKYEPFVGELCCRFPNSALRNVKNRLEELEINFVTADMNHFAYAYYAFEDNNNYQNFYNSIEQVNIEKEEIQCNSIDSNVERVEIGDTVSICNLKTNATEKYTIIKTYYTPKLVGFDVQRGDGFGSVIYRDELVDYSNLEEGKILSESEIAKKLLGSSLNSIILLNDDNEKACQYKIIDIQKNYEML